MAKLPKRPRDPAQLAKLMVDMASGEVPNDKEQVLEALGESKPPAETPSRKPVRAPASR